MNTSYNTKHYTYHIGTSSELNSSKTVCYFLSDNIKLNTLLSISSLGEYYKELKEKYPDTQKGVSWSQRIESSEEGQKDYFILEPTGPDGIIEFNTIIYVNLSGKPIGYTYFSETQSNQKETSRIGEMKMSFEFSIVNNIVDFDFSYSLDSIWAIKDPVQSSKFITSLDQVLDYYDKQVPGKTNFNRYTQELQKLSGKDHYCITDSATHSSDGSYCFWIPKIPLKTVVEYTNYDIGYYSGDLVLYRWTDTGEYSVDSLTKFNHFGIPRNIKTGKAYFGESERIYGMVDKVILLSEGTKERCGFIDFTNNFRYCDPSKRVINDPWDTKGDIQIIDSGAEANDLDLGFLSQPPGKYYYLLEKRGPWYIFINESTGSKAWCSMYGTAYFGKYDNPLLISERVIMKVSGSMIHFYMFDGQSCFYENSDPTYSMSNVYVNPEGIDKQEITPIELIDGIRKRPLPSRYLDFLGKSTKSFRGIVFYLDSDNNICIL